MCCVKHGRVRGKKFSTTLLRVEYPFGKLSSSREIQEEVKTGFEQRCRRKKNVSYAAIEKLADQTQLHESFAQTSQMYKFTRAENAVPRIVRANIEDIYKFTIGEPASAAAGI